MATRLPAESNTGAPDSPDAVIFGLTSMSAVPMGGNLALRLLIVAVLPLGISLMVWPTVGSLVVPLIAPLLTAKLAIGSAKANEIPSADIRRMTLAAWLVLSKLI